MSDLPKTHTHTAYAYQRTGKKFGRLLEVGSGRIDHDRNIVHVVMNRQPIGGYTGYVVLSPHGGKPPPPQAQPQRPGENGDEAESQDEGEAEA
jgi:hypothetical protein